MLISISRTARERATPTMSMGPLSLAWSRPCEGMSGKRMYYFLGIAGFSSRSRQKRRRTGPRRSSARYYLMGFLYYENFIFAEELLRTIHPRASVLVINVDGFFDRSESSPVKTILHDPDAREEYETKRLWQRVHAPICAVFSRLCGTKFVIFRSRETGAYDTEGDAEQKEVPVSFDQSVDQGVVKSSVAAATSFLSRFARDKCVILTDVPFVETRIGNADAIAKGIGAKLVAPGLLDGLQTFDGTHSNRRSAERWSRAFFAAADQEIRSCVEEPSSMRPARYQSIPQ